MRKITVGLLEECFELMVGGRRCYACKGKRAIKSFRFDLRPIRGSAADVYGFVGENFVDDIRYNGVFCRGAKNDA